MNVEHYKLYQDVEFLHFEFFSEGPNGKIRKIIQYQEFSPGSQIYNLGFGDWNESAKRLDDLSVTNNNDREKVLATVAATVLEFLGDFPDMMVYAQGSTPSRTRLYQIGIATHYHEISSVLKIYGFINDEWESFRRNRNYEAFLVSLK